MKVFLSYRFTGEDLNELGKILAGIKSVLTEHDHQVFCSFDEEENFKEQGLTSEQIYDYCLRVQEDSTVFLAFVKSEHHSSGMQKESRKAQELGQKYILLIRRGLDFPEYRKMANMIIEYSSYEELYDHLKYL